MNSVDKVRSISVWIFIIPFISVNSCLLIVTNFHQILEPGVPINPTFPYFDGGVSISRTVRDFPLYLIFKPAMFITSFLLILYWFNTKKITYNQIPSIFFIASSNKIEDILPTSTIIKEGLSFNYLLENKTSQRNFISDVSLDTWKDNFVRIKKSKNLFKEYNVENIDNKLFQTRIFFPAKSIPGEYKVNVYQIEDNLILNNKEKIITLKKSGIGSQIYNFAHKNAAAYGLFAIIFAILSGFLAATLFRRS